MKLIGLSSDIYEPTTYEDAINALTANNPNVKALAGGTWIMRSMLRKEDPASTYVPLGGLPQLSSLKFGEYMKMGACLSHADIAKGLPVGRSLDVLRQAAGNSANPSIRQMATLGGNLATEEFAAADLVPALLCLDAEVTAASAGGDMTLPLSEYLERRSELKSNTLVTGVQVPKATEDSFSAHARLTMRRRGGDYPVGIVSLSFELDEENVVSGIRAAVGSVEQTARRWTELEEALMGRPLEAEHAGQVSAGLISTLNAREGNGASAWYRREIVPSLVRRAVLAAMGTV